MAVAGDMAGEEKLAVSISSDGSPREEKKTETRGRKKPPAPPSLLQHHLVLAPGRGGGPSGYRSRAPGGPGAGRPRTYLGQCPGRGALRVLRAPGGRSWPRQPPRWLHRRRRLRAAPGGAPCQGARQCGAPISPVQPRVGGARLDGAPGRGALALAGAAGVRPSVRLGARPAHPLPRRLLSDPGQGRARSPLRPGAPRLPARSGRASPSPPATVPREAMAAARPGEGGESGMEGEEAAGGRGSARTQLRAPLPPEPGSATPLTLRREHARPAPRRRCPRPPGP